jgi:hypothetical protein
MEGTSHGFRRVTANGWGERVVTMTEVELQALVRAVALVREDEALVLVKQKLDSQEWAALGRLHRDFEEELHG